MHPHRPFFDLLGAKLGYKSMDDWYKLRQRDILKNGGAHLNEFVVSPSKALRTVYPDHNWTLWKFHFVPLRYWEDISNLRSFFDWVGTQLEYKQMEDWYSISLSQIQKLGGKGVMLTHFHDSPTKALHTVYPEHKWLPWRFNSISHGFWEKVDNQRIYLDWLFSQLGYSNMDDWYQLTQEHVMKHGGTRLLSFYNGSHSTALQSIYPQHEWMLWRFHMLPQSYWKKLMNNPKEQELIIHWLGDKLGTVSLSSWYRISMRQIHKLVRIESSDMLAYMLRTVYPSHNWDLDKLSKQGGISKASQRELVIAMKQLFPQHSRCPI